MMHWSHFRKTFLSSLFWTQFIRLLPWMIAGSVAVGCGLNMALAKLITVPNSWTPAVLVDLAAESLVLFAILFILAYGFLIGLPKVTFDLLSIYLRYWLRRAAANVRSALIMLVPQPAEIQERQRRFELALCVAAAFAVARSYRLKPTLARKHKTPLLLFQQANLLLAP